LRMSRRTSQTNYGTETGSPGGSIRLVRRGTALPLANLLDRARALRRRTRTFARRPERAKGGETPPRCGERSKAHPQRSPLHNSIHDSAANGQRSHAGPVTLDCERDALPALAAASGWPRASSPEFPPWLGASCHACIRHRYCVRVFNLTSLRIEDSKTVLASQLPNECIYILRLGPNARHDDVAG